MSDQLVKARKLLFRTRNVLDYLRDVPGEENRQQVESAIVSVKNAQIILLEIIETEREGTK